MNLRIMTPQSKIRAMVLTLVLGGTLMSPAGVFPQTMADYTASPPFITAAVPPNVLLLMDNSGSMNEAAYKTAAFDPSKTYFGLYDPLECYDYSSNKFIPDPAPNPATPGTCTNAPYLWSGNLLNYATMRRIDIVKWVMIGGICSVGGRDAQGGCRQLIGQYTFDSSACCRDQTTSVPYTHANGRVPSAYLPGAGGTLYFHMMGSNATLKGSFCLDNDSTKPGTSSSSCNDGDAYAESGPWTIRVDHFENASGIIQRVGNKARFGLMQFKGVGDGGKVLSDVGGNIQSMITAIEATTPSTWTPLAESLYEATRYFAQIPPAYTNSDYSYTVTNRDPYYFTAPQWAGTSQYVKCCKSFVIVFTDGEPTQDLNVPSSLQDYAHAVHGSHCTGATQADPCTPHKTNYAYNGSHYLDDVAYYAHTTDLRQATLPVINETGKALDGNQNLNIYTFYAFGQAIGREILQTTAKAGGFEDRNGNNLPDLPEEYDRYNNYTGALGADGLPDTYFESANADDLREKLMAAITSILQRSASGTAVSVLASSSTGDGSLYQAYFYPTLFEGLNEIKWTGYVQGLFLDTFGNLREDTDGDAKLIYQNDTIVTTRFDAATGNVLIDRFRDTNGDGKADTPTPFETVTLKEVKGIWEAGQRLALTPPDHRTVLTWVDLNNNGVVDAGEQMDFTAVNSATLAPYLLAGAAPYTADNIIHFIRGEHITGLRDRQLTVGGSLKVWKLGDTVHSTPTVVGAPKERFDVLYGDSSYTAFFEQYRNRRQVVYVGANDGMLHAFNAGFYHRGDDPSTTTVTEHGWFTRNPTDNTSGKLLGEELWGFIPYELLPHLQWLTRSDYTHVYYVDLKPKVVDVRIFTPDADHPNGWGTILIGGFRMGGSCGNCSAGSGAPPMTVNIGGTDRTFYSAYFVLDITNPEVAPKLLWSFSSPDLGLSTSYPTVVRVSPSSDEKTSNTNAKWYVVFGSGPTGYDGSAAQRAKLYAVDLATGPGANNSLVTTFPVGSWLSFMGDLITLDRDFDYRADAVYVGRAIDPTSSGRGIWSGKMYRLTMGACSSAPCSTATWGVVWGTTRIPTVMIDTFPTSGGTVAGPIVAAPAVTLDDTAKVWVFFGTGRYYSAADKTNTETQYFFGIKDSVMSGSCTQSSVGSCMDNDLVNISGATICVVGVGMCGSGTNQVTGVTGVTTFEGSGTTSLIGLVQSKDGWFTTLPALRERVLASPTIIGGIVFFPSFIPNDDICNATGESNLYALFYLTGSAYKDSVIGTTAAGSNQTVNRSLALGTGLASQMAVQIVTQGDGDTGGVTSGSGCQGSMIGFVQSSTGAIGQSCTKLAMSIWSHYLSWINQRD